MTLSPVLKWSYKIPILQMELQDAVGSACSVAPNGVDSLQILWNVWKRMFRGGSFILEMKSKSQGLKSVEYEECMNGSSLTSSSEQTHQPQFTLPIVMQDD